MLEGLLQITQLIIERKNRFETKQISTFSTERTAMIIQTLDEIITRQYKFAYFGQYCHFSEELKLSFRNWLTPEIWQRINS